MIPNWLFKSPLWYYQVFLLPWTHLNPSTCPSTMLSCQYRRQQRTHSCFLPSTRLGTALIIYHPKGTKCHRKITLTHIAFYNFEHLMKNTKIPVKREKIWMGTRSSPHTLLCPQWRASWYNDNCIISMQGFVWVIFFKQKQKLCYPALLTVYSFVTGWFHFFSTKRLKITGDLTWSSYIVYIYVWSCSSSM